MKNKDLRLKDMYNYIQHTPLNIPEARCVFELEKGDVRSNDIPYVYLMVHCVKGLTKRGYDVTKLPKIFLNRFADLSFFDATDLMNVMYFKEDLGMNDIYKAVKIFYDFFNDDIDYDNDRLNAIKGYIIQDEDVKNRLYRTLTVCLVNLMAGANDNKFHELLEDIDYSVIYQYLQDNKLEFDEDFNKNMFLSLYSYLLFYVNEKGGTKTL